MRVVLARGLFAHADPLEIAAIFGLGWNGRHRILAEDLGEADAWIAARDADVASATRLVLEESLKADNTLPRGAEVRVVAGATRWGDVPELRMVDALDLLTEPLRIWVENSASDRGFLWFVVGPELRKTLSNAERRGWLSVMMGGGGTLYAQIRRLRGPQEAGRRWRSWAMFDSDRLSAIDRDAKSTRLETLCTRVLPGRFWALERRSIENYLPVRTMALWAAEGGGAPSRKRLFDAWRVLPTDAAWYFNMKHGIRGDADHDRRAAAVWQGSLPTEQLHVLEGGFGEHVADRFVNDDALRAGPDAAAQAEATIHVDTLRGLL